MTKHQGLKRASHQTKNTHSRVVEIPLMKSRVVEIVRAASPIVHALIQNRIRIRTKREEEESNLIFQSIILKMEGAMMTDGG